MKYAVIKLQGKQYRVEEGQKLVVSRMAEGEGKSVPVGDILLYVDGDTVELGKPLVPSAKVKLKVLSHGKGDKVRVATFKAKSRERKVRGHRDAETTVEIQSISLK